MDTANYIPDFYKRFMLGDTKVDFYFICQLYEITDPCIAHSLKKLLRAGRSHKDIWQDVKDVIDTMQRWQQLNPRPQPMSINPDEPKAEAELFEETVYSVHYFAVKPTWAIEQGLDNIDALTVPGWYVVKAGPFANTMGNVPYLSHALALAHANAEKFEWETKYETHYDGGCTGLFKVTPGGIFKECDRCHFRKTI